MNKGSRRVWIMKRWWTKIVWVESKRAKKCLLITRDLLTNHRKNVCWSLGIPLQIIEKNVCWSLEITLQIIYAMSTDHQGFLTNYRCNEHWSLGIPLQIIDAMRGSDYVLLGHQGSSTGHSHWFGCSITYWPDMLDLKEHLQIILFYKIYTFVFTMTIRR